MKQTTLKHVPEQEIRTAIANLTEKEGSQIAVANKMNLVSSQLNRFLRGNGMVPKAVCKFFGLEARTVYVKNGGQ